MGPRATIASVLLLACVASGVGARLWADGPRSVSGGGITLTLGPTARTGHQRAARLAFCDEGRRLAVLCPRYNRLSLFGVSVGPRLAVEDDVALEGRPVALAVTPDRLYVLQRPVGDARHLGPAWWDAFGFDGQRLGDRFHVGFDPDDLLLGADGVTAYVLLSGDAEGETGRPAPSLLVVDLSDPERPRRAGEVTLAGEGIDPERLAWEGDRMAVELNDGAARGLVDVSEPDAPRFLGWERSRNAPVVVRPLVRSSALALALRVDGSALEARVGDRTIAGLRLGGLGGIRATDLALCAGPDGSGVAAVSDRSGGVHLVSIAVSGGVGRSHAP